MDPRDAGEKAARLGRVTRSGHSALLPLSRATLTRILSCNKDLTRKGVCILGQTRIRPRGGRQQSVREASNAAPPFQVDALTGLGAVKVECGSQFSVALTKSGAVYTWYARLVLNPIKVLTVLIARHVTCLAGRDTCPETRCQEGGQVVDGTALNACPVFSRAQGQRRLPQAGPRVR